MAEDLTQLGDKVHGMATDMASAHKSAEGLGSVFKQAAVYAGAYETIRHVIGEIGKRSAYWQGFEAAISRENLSQLNLTEKHLRLLGDKRKLEVQVRRTSGEMKEHQQAQLDAVKGQLNVLERQKALAYEVQKIGHSTFALFAAYKVAALDLFIKQREFNQNLIEANSSFAHRNQLLKDTLMLQTRGGIAFDKVTDAARALVHYGLDAETTFESNLGLVAKMHQGLGVSVDESARLASIVERQVKGSFEGVAHTVAQIVNDTALAGDEAARLATNISTALGRLRPGMSAAGLPDVLRLVGRYEGALKEVGGAAGAVQQLLTQMTTPEGIVGAGALGVNPEFLATANGVQEVMTRFGNYGEMLVGQSSGWERQMRLQALAQQFNLSADQANQLMIAVKRANQQQMGAITLQDRWKEQLNATNSGISRLTNSLWGLLQTGLLPVVNVIGFLLNKIADLVEWLLQSKATVAVLSGALLIAGVALTINLYGVARAMWSVVAASVATQVALARQSAAQMVLPGLGGGAAAAGGGGGVLRFLIRPLTAIASGLSVLGIAVAALAAVAGYLVWTDVKIWMEVKALREDNIAQQKIIISKEQALEAQRKAGLYSAARFGTAADVTAIYKKLAIDAGAKFSEESDPRKRRAMQQDWLDKQLADAKYDIAKGITTRGMFETLTERTPEEVKRDDEMKAASDKLYKVNDEQKIILDKRLKQAQEAIQEAATERAKTRAWGTAVDYWSDKLF